MSEARGVTFGLDFMGEDALNTLGGIVNELGSIHSAAGVAEDGAQSLANELGQAGKAGGGALSDVKNEAEALADELGETAKRSGKELSDLGKNAKGVGDAFRTVTSESLKAGNSITKSVGTGIAGMAKNAVTQIKGIGTTMASTAKGITQAIAHPGQAIRGTLIKALGDAEESTEDLGEEARKTGRELGDMGRKGSSGADSLAKTIKGVIAAVASAAIIGTAVSAIKDFTGAALEAAGAAEVVSARIEASFGASAGEASAWAENFAGDINRSATEVKGILAQDMGLYKSLGLTNEAAEQLAKTSTALAYDLGAAFKMDDADAHQKLQNAIKGNADAAAAFGLSLDDATLKQTAMSMGIKTGIKDMDDATLAQVRMAAILDQTRDSQLAAATSTGGLVNGMKGLTGVWDNFMSKAGDKFMPMVDQLFGAFFEMWPTLEPVLLELVDILAEGFADALPIFIDLGKSLIPTLASTLGKLMEAAKPILPLVAELIGTLLPPLAEIFGMLAETILPPLTDIFMVLLNDVIQPLLPVIMELISALLPPFVDLLGMIAPVISEMSPLLITLASLLVPIAGVLGDFIGSLLPPLMSILDVVVNSLLMPLMPIIGMLIETLLPPLAMLLGVIAPILELIAPVLEAITPIMELQGAILGVIAEVLAKVIGWLADGVGKVVGFFSSMFGGASESKKEVDELSGAVGSLTDATSDPPVLGIETSAYTKDVAKAAGSAADAVSESAVEAREISDANFAAMGLDAKAAYGTMTVDAETAWQRMVKAAEDGADAIINAFGRMAEAALGVNNANLQVTGPDIPHHASGTSNFEGGATYIHEQGDEMAIMPSGSKIITAAQSKTLLNSMAQKGGGQSKLPDININIYGNVDTPTIEELKQQLTELIRRIINEQDDEEEMLIAVQEGLAR